MQYKIIVVGKTKNKDIQALEAVYMERLGHFADVTVRVVKAASEQTNQSHDAIKRMEAEAIEKEIPKNSYVLAFDEAGKEYTSPEFANFLDKKIVESGGSICAIIGGTFGLDKTIHARADSVVSLSRMTFTHEFVRVMLFEQLYRAHMIISGRPYHY
ncbi:MAG: 23S rRNA (pseudouridine(1915)-N(3))-methyltransferase RlmH [Patescibacteria group bacterium]